MKKTNSLGDNGISSTYFKFSFQPQLNQSISNFSPIQLFKKLSIIITQIQKES